jgi:hypothetical protein
MTTAAERLADSLESMNARLARMETTLGEVRAEQCRGLIRMIISKKEGLSWLRSVIFALLAFLAGILASQGLYLPTPPPLSSPIAPATSAP